VTPTTYVDWRDLYRRTIHAFGYATFRLEEFRRLNAPDVLLLSCARRRWRLLHRLRRVKNRLRVEHEAMDVTFLAELLPFAEGGDE
jgi:hypothetical protein